MIYGRYILNNIAGSLAHKMSHFVQNKSQAAKALDVRMKKGELNKLIPDLQLIFKIKKDKTKTSDALLSILPSRTFVQNIIPKKTTVLPEKSSKWAGKALRFKNKEKMLFQTIIML